MSRPDFCAASDAQQVRVERRPPHVLRAVSGRMLAQVVAAICDTAERA